MKIKMIASNSLIPVTRKEDSLSFNENIIYKAFEDLEKVSSRIKKKLLKSYIDDYASKESNYGSHEHYSYNIQEKGIPVEDNSTHQLSNFHHKLIRLQKEFQFAKRNINNFKLLTQREKEIIKLLVKGINNPDVAEKLFISRSTVEQHRKNINRKLKIKSFAHLIHFAYAFNLI